FLLYFTAVAVGVGEADLNLETLRRQLIVDMGFARQGGGARWQPLRSVVGVILAGALEAVEVVDDARRRTLEQARRRHVWVFYVEESINLRLCQVRFKILKRIALDCCRNWFAHDGRARYQTQRVKDHLGAVAVRVGHQPWT